MLLIFYYTYYYLKTQNKTTNYSYKIDSMFNGY